MTSPDKDAKTAQCGCGAATTVVRPKCLGCGQTLCGECLDTSLDDGGGLYCTPCYEKRASR